MKHIDAIKEEKENGKRRKRRQNFKRLGNTTYPVVNRETSAEYLHLYKDLPGLKGDYARKCFIYLK